MAVVKHFTSVMLLASAVSCCATQADSAREIIKRLVEMRRTPPCTMVQTQVYDASGAIAQFVVELDGTGRSRRTAIKPLRLQGTITIDNGKVWATVLPDEKKIMLQESPVGNRIDSGFRMQQIDRNYRLATERSRNVAGRKTTTIVATPRYPDMPRREYSLDAETEVLLRIVLIESNGKPKEMLDTIAVRYGTKPPEDFFRIPKDDDFEINNCPSLRRIHDVGMASKRVGFAPRTPSSLPFGFEVAEAHLCGDEKSAFVAVRISDGFAQGTIYQWDSKKRSKGFPFSHDFDVQDSEGVRYLIFGELPKAVKAKLAELFSKLERNP